MKTLAKKTAKEKVEKPIKFTKQQILKSKKYINRQDALSALLDDEKAYSHQEVEKMLNKFYKGGKK